MEEAVDLYQRALSCLGGLGGDKGGRLVLSLYFKAVLGVQRIFHFDSLSDIGFAWPSLRRRRRELVDPRVDAIGAEATGEVADPLTVGVGVVASPSSREPEHSLEGRAHGLAARPVRPPGALGPPLLLTSS